MNHTPRPWQLLKSNNENYFIIGADSTEEVCAGVHFTLEIALIVKNHGQPNLANAQLIRAAPELLNALETIFGMSSVLPDDKYFREFAVGMCQNAIAKAIKEQA